MSGEARARFNVANAVIEWMEAGGAEKVAMNLLAQTDEEHKRARTVLLKEIEEAVSEGVFKAMDTGRSFAVFYARGSADMPERVRRQLASLIHDIWTNWMKYLFSKSVGIEMGGASPLFPGDQPNKGHLIPSGLVERWERQMETPLWELPQAERLSDIELADEVFALLADGMEGPTAPVDDRERVASTLCDIWGHWMAFMFSRWHKHDPSRLEVPPEIVSRWLSQSVHGYSDLPEDIDREDPDGKRVSKELFRHWADEMLAAMEGTGASEDVAIEWCPECGADGTEFKQEAMGRYRCGRCDGVWEIARIKDAG